MNTIEMFDSSKAKAITKAGRRNLINLNRLMRAEQKWTTHLLNNRRVIHRRGKTFVIKADKIKPIANDVLKEWVNYKTDVFSKGIP